MKTIINTIVALTFLATTQVSAEVSKPYAVFNPLAMFSLPAKNTLQRVDSAFYNYGHRGYEFVVEAFPTPEEKLPQQLASLDR